MPFTKIVIFHKCNKITTRLLWLSRSHGMNHCDLTILWILKHVVRHENTQNFTFHLIFYKYLSMCCRWIIITYRQSLYISQSNNKIFLLLLLTLFLQLVISIESAFFVLFFGENRRYFLMVYEFSKDVCVIFTGFGDIIPHLKNLGMFRVFFLIQCMYCSRIYPIQ